MAGNREGETATGTKFRTDRMFKQGDGWYFNTREGSVEGPFGDLLEAKSRLEAYIRLTNSGLVPLEGTFSLKELEA